MCRSSIRASSRSSAVRRALSTSGNNQYSLRLMMTSFLPGGYCRTDQHRHSSGFGRTVNLTLGASAAETLALCSSAMSTPAIAFDRFYRYDELTEILHGLARDHPQIVAIESIGRSH